jgi:hypothetical protein
MTDKPVEIVDHTPMTPKITSIDHTDEGIIIVFANGITSMFGTDFLYAQVDKRIRTRESQSGVAKKG